MGKRIKVIVLLSLFIICFTSIAQGANITDINQLIEGAKTYDGQEVTVKGEAIGEALERGEFAWVNINDGSNAIGIWLALDDAKIISFFGDYKNKGDIIEVTGIFSRDCKEHGGDVDIHSNIISIIQKGFVEKESLAKTKIIIGIVSVVFALFIFFFFLKQLKRPSESQ